MNHKQVLQLVIAVILVMSFLVGCVGSAPTTVSEAPAATPKPPTATPTPKPPTATSTPVPPTETSTPAIAKPQPGATFNGAMEVSEAGSNGTASSGTIKLVISDDGMSITSAEITLTDLKCPSSSSGSTTLTVDGPASVSEGKIEMTASGLGKQIIKGQFTSPTEANGTVTLTLEIPLEKPCDLGMWNWSANSTATPEIASAPTEIPSVTSLPPTDTPVPAIPTSILSGVYTTGGSELSFSKIYFKEEKPDIGVYYPSKLLGIVDFFVLKISSSSDIKIKFSDIKSIDLGPNPEGVYGSGWGIVTLRSGEQIKGAFSGEGGGDVDIYIMVGNSEVKIDLRYNMEKSRIDFN